MWGELLDEMKGCPGSDVRWDLLKAYADRKESVCDEKYLKVCRLVLQKVKPLMFDESWKETTFETLLLRSDPHLVILLTSCLSLEQEETFKRSVILGLIRKMIYEGDLLEGLLLNQSEGNFESRETDQTLETLLVSLPEKVSNICRLKTPQEFAPNNYFTRLSGVLWACLQKVYSRLSQGQQMSLEFVSCLLGRVCFNGYADIVWKKVLVPLAGECEKDFVWRRISHRLLIATQKDKYLEAVVKPIFCLSSRPEKIKWLIGSDVEHNSKLAYLLTHKFLLIHCFPHPLAVKNIVGYLVSSHEPSFLIAFDNVISAWGSASSLKHRSYSQHLYLSSVLMVSSRFLSTGPFAQKDKFFNLTMHGIEVHLKTSQADVRDVGLSVGQVLVRILKPDGPELSFPTGESEDVKKLLALLDEDVELQENIESKEMASSDAEKCCITSEDQSALLVEVEVEEEEFEPYDMSNDKPVESIKKPVYLRDCLNGLIEKENPEWTQACLEAAETLIKKNAYSASEISAEFAKVVLYMDNSSDMLNFTGLRHRTLIALLICSPTDVSQYLTSQFYDRNHTIRNRLDILEVLLSASQELADPAKLDMKPNQVHPTLEGGLQELMLLSKDMAVAEEHWQQIVRNRVERNTRILSVKPNKVEVTANKFTPVAGSFFFPLLEKYDATDVTFDLKGEDHYVLGRLIYTLGILLNSTSQALIARQMGKCLMQFLWAFRYHCEVFVRQSIIFGICMVMNSVPPIYLLGELGDEVFEWRNWLMDVTEKDADEECVKRASLALELFNKIVHENQSVNKPGIN